MAKIKDTILDEQRFRDKELEASEPKDYQFSEADHCHTFKGKPLLGTSTVVGVIAKPLTWWASGLAVEKFGWINSKKRVNGKYTTIDEKTRLEAILPHLEAIKNETPEQFLKRCDEAYKAHSVKLDTSADAGTDLHAELERYVKNTMEDRMATYDDKIVPFITWANENVEKFLWSEIHTFSETLWVGGISDCGVKLKNGQVGIIDFKSSKESYENQFIQCAGYDLQLTENGGYTDTGVKKLELKEPITFYGIVPFGAEKFTVDFRFNTEELREGFKSAVTLYKLTNK